MSERELLHTDRVLVVEGKYDAARLSHLTDAMILLTDGFGIYSDKRRQQLFKALAQKNGLILLTDSDAAGFRIRTYITNLVGERMWFRLTCPRSTARKSARNSPARRACWGSRAWTMPLFYRRCGMPLALRRVPQRPARKDGKITYTDLYEWGLSGRPGSAERKAKLLNALGLPPRLSKKELVEALNRLYTFEQLDKLQLKILDS